MISVEMEDVLAVLQLCKPYIIGIIAALVIGIINYDSMPQDVQGQKISDKRGSCDRNGSCSCCLREYDLFWTNGYVDWTGNGKWNFKR